MFEEKIWDVVCKTHGCTHGVEVVYNLFYKIWRKLKLKQQSQSLLLLLQQEEGCREESMYGMAGWVCVRRHKMHYLWTG